MERETLHAIRLDLGRELDLVLFRNAAGVFDAFNETTGKAQKVRTGLTVGASDLLGILAPFGRWFALEVKTDKGRVSKEQEQFLALIRRMGGFGAVVRSVDDARAALNRARMGASE